MHINSSGTGSNMIRPSHRCWMGNPTRTIADIGVYCGYTAYILGIAFLVYFYTGKFDKFKFFV